MSRFTLKKHSTLSAQQQAFKDMKRANIPAYYVFQETIILSQPRLTIRVGLLGL